MNSYVFENKYELVQQYKELDVEINQLIRNKMNNSGGNFSNPLSNSSTEDENITRSLMTTMLTSGQSANRIRDALSEASDGVYVV